MGLSRVFRAFERWDAELRGAVDVITCNPPYIPLDAWESVAPEARDHDPHLALFSGADGLDAMRVLEARAALLEIAEQVEMANVEKSERPGIGRSAAASPPSWRNTLSR